MSKDTLISDILLNYIHKNIYLHDLMRMSLKEQMKYVTASQFKNLEKFSRWEQNYKTNNVQTIWHTNQEIIQDIARIHQEYHLSSILNLNGYLLKYCDETTRDNEKTLLGIIKKYPLAFQYVSDRLKNNFDFVMHAIYQNIENMQFASISLRRNIAFYHEIDRYHDKLPMHFVDSSMIVQLSSFFEKNKQIETNIKTRTKIIAFDKMNESQIYQKLLQSSSNTKYIFSEKILFNPSPEFVSLLKDMPRIWFYFTLQRDMVKNKIIQQDQF